MSLPVVCWRWGSYPIEPVHVLRNMVARHYPHPHHIVCITDDPAGLDPDIRVVPLWPDYRNLRSPHSGDYPGCYNRLRIFSEEMRDLIGPRFVSIDLDMVITGGLSPLWNRPEPFVIWAPGRSSKHNGPVSTWNASMFLMDAGVYPEVWSLFDGAPAGWRAYNAGWHGSDQGWMESVILGGVATWRASDGIYGFSRLVKQGHDIRRLPSGARVISFAGKVKPWSEEAQRLSWVRRHYR